MNVFHSIRTFTATLFFQLCLIPALGFIIIVKVGWQIKIFLKVFEMYFKYTNTLQIDKQVTDTTEA